MKEATVMHSGRARHRRLWNAAMAANFELEDFYRKGHATGGLASF